MSQGELTSHNHERETKMRQIEKGWLTNRDNGRKIGLKSARERLTHKLQQFEGDGSQSAIMRGRLVHKPERNRA